MTPAEVAALRVAANRAEVAALALRRLARNVAVCDMDEARHVGILAADVAEAAGALERLEPATAIGLMAMSQARAIQGKSVRVGPDTLNRWAAAWEAFAIEVDP